MSPSKAAVAEPSAILEELDLFDSFGKTRVNGSRPLKCKVETFESADCWGEFEEPKTIRLHSELSKRDALVILFHEAAHALWTHEGLGKKEDEETVCTKIAEGLARMILGNPIEHWVAAAKSESWEIPRHRWETPHEFLALDCEGIEKAVGANRCVRRAPMDYRPADMFSHAGKSSPRADWRSRNRYLCRQGVKAVRTARERVKQSLAHDPSHLWYISLELLEVATYSLRVRLFWRNGDRADFKPTDGESVAREQQQRTWHGRMMREWDHWSRNGPLPSPEAMFAAMNALSQMRP